MNMETAEPDLRSPREIITALAAGTDLARLSLCLRSRRRVRRRAGRRHLHPVLTDTPCQRPRPSDDRPG